jgi:putative oxidoreductase
MTTTPPATKSLRLVLWITQIVLALMFGMSGWMKATYAPETLAMYVPWSPDVPIWLVKLIGTCEFVGAFGLVLPAATRIRPMLTPVSALLLTLVMVFAMGFHLARGETHALGMPLMLGLLSAFVAWGRGKRAVIEERVK